MSLRHVPGYIGDRPQHGIEHDGARHLMSPERPADRTVIVGEEKKLVAADRGETGDIIGLPGENAADNDVVLTE